jgi:hypothetical protein
MKLSIVVVALTVASEVLVAVAAAVSAPEVGTMVINL